MAGKVFVTSDLHFGHNKEFLWEPRGFSGSKGFMRLRNIRFSVLNLSSV